MSIFNSNGNNLRNNLMREMIAPQSSLDANPKAKLLPIEKLVSNPFQIRQDFDSEEAVAALEELAADIREQGILQPILVRPSVTAGKFEIVAGERRYRAAQIANLEQIPAIVEVLSDEQARLISLTENLQRRNLNFKEEVDFLVELNEQRNIQGLGGDTDISRLIHKSRTYVAKRLKLASFPELIERVTNNEISINQAYSEAVESDQLPFTPIASEEMYNVFPGNIFSSKELPFSKEIVAEQPESIPNTQPQIYIRTRNPFKTRMVPINRAKEALKLVEQDIGNFKEEERFQLKEVLDELSKALTLLRSKLGN